MLHKQQLHAFERATYRQVTGDHWIKSRRFYQFRDSLQGLFIIACHKSINLLAVDDRLVKISGKCGVKRFNNLGMG